MSAKHEATVALQGLELFRYDVRNIYAPDRWLLRSWIDRETGAATHQLYYEDHYRHDDWCAWYAASNDGANPLPFLAIDRRVVTCSNFGPCVKEEIFGVAIDDGFLRGHRETGFSVQIAGENGDQLDVHVSARQIGDQIRTIEAVREDPAAY